MRSANCRWLKPLRRRNERIEYAIFRCPRPLEWTFTGSTSGAGVIAAISASSSSNDRWQRRQRLLDVQNCTKRQRSHRTTSRESTGVSVVAIQVLRVREQGLLSKPTTRYSAGWNLWKSRQKYEKQGVYRKQNANQVAKLARNRPKRMNKPDAAWCLLTEFTQSESLRKHALAVEAGMPA